MLNLKPILLPFVSVPLPFTLTLLKRLLVSSFVIEVSTAIEAWLQLPSISLIQPVQFF